MLKTENSIFNIKDVNRVISKIDCLINNRSNFKNSTQKALMALFVFQVDNLNLICYYVIR